MCPRKYHNSLRGTSVTGSRKKAVYTLRWTADPQTTARGRVGLDKLTAQAAAAPYGAPGNHLVLEYSRRGCRPQRQDVWALPKKGIKIVNIK